MADDLKALSAQIDAFPALVTARLRAVAWRTSRDVKARAHDLAPRDESAERGDHTRGHPHLADAIVITEQADQKQFLVEPQTPWLPNLGLWIERGTSKMRARPFMRPAGEALTAQYQREMTRAAEQAATDGFK